MRGTGGTRQAVTQDGGHVDTLTGATTGWWALTGVSTKGVASVGANNGADYLVFF